MTADELIDLAQRKNAAHRVLREARNKAYVPNSLQKMTTDERKLQIDFLTRVQQEQYDNLVDEYEIRKLAYSLQQ